VDGRCRGALRSGDELRDGRGRASIDGVADHPEMTQADLADRVGLTRQTIIAIEQGKYSPTLEIAFQIARVFQVPLDQAFQPRDRPRVAAADRAQQGAGCGAARRLRARRRGALMFYVVLYRSRLVPRWLSVWGLVGAVLYILPPLRACSGTHSVSSWAHSPCRKMVLAVWLIAKGFNSPAIAAESAGETSRWRVGPGTVPAA
jgi:putative transcriptional regulator